MYDACLTDCPVCGEESNQETYWVYELLLPHPSTPDDYDTNTLLMFVAVYLPDIEEANQALNDGDVELWTDEEEANTETVEALAAHGIDPIEYAAHHFRESALIYSAHEQVIE